jgi:hypothetical protein
MEAADRRCASTSHAGPADAISAVRLLPFDAQIQPHQPPGQNRARQVHARTKGLNGIGGRAAVEDIEDIQLGLQLHVAHRECPGQAEIEQVDAIQKFAARLVETSRVSGWPGRL